MVTEFISLFCITALLFFIVSGLTKFKFVWIVVPLNVAFLGILFFSYIQFIGAAVPMDTDIPFWKYQTFTAKTLETIKTYYVTDDLIHVIVCDDKQKYKYITFKNTPAFQDAWTKAVLASEKEHAPLQVMIATDTTYPDGSQGNFPDTEIQANHHEEKPSYNEGVESHDATGNGMKSD
jgi:hypothetical protein